MAPKSDSSAEQAHPADGAQGAPRLIRSVGQITSLRYGDGNSDGRAADDY